MKVVLKVARINETRYLLLDKLTKTSIENLFKLDLDSIKYIEADIIDYCNTDAEIKNFKCSYCLYHFDQADENPYCPACGNESVEEVSDETLKPMQVSQNPLQAIDNIGNIHNKVKGGNK